MELKNYVPNVSHNAEWKILGPGGGGALYIPTVSPFDMDTAIVACDMTGSYITHDGGEHWKELNFKACVGSFAFDPRNKGVIYAGATGLYRSEDNGERWRLVFPDPAHLVGEVMEGDHADHAFAADDGWPGGKVTAIAMDPAKPECIFIAINRQCGHIDGRNTQEVLIFYSGNRGADWKQVLKVACDTDSASSVKLLLDPTSAVESRRLLVFTDTGIYLLYKGMTEFESFNISIQFNVRTIMDVTWGMDRTSGKLFLYLLCSSKGESERYLSRVYKSEDYCNTWQEVMSGLDADQTDGQSRKFTRIAACLNDASTVYLSCCEPDEAGIDNPSSVFYFGVFKSGDFGQSWKWALKIGDRNPENRKSGWVEREYATDWGGAPFNFGVSPSDANVCYATDWGTVYRTLDGGTSWEQLYCNEQPDSTYSSRGLDVINIYGIHFDPFSKEHMAITCTDVGLFTSANNGISWKHSHDGVPSQWINTCYWLVFDPEIKGKAWSVWSDCHDLPRPKMIRSGKVDRSVGGVCRSEDGMETWKKSSAGIPGNCAVTHIILDHESPAGNRTLYATGFGKGVFKSENDGIDWALKNNGIEDNLNAWKLIILPDGTIYLLVARGLENGKSVDGALYQSNDGADSWQKVKLPAGANFPNDLCFDPSNPQRMYLACWPESTTEGERGGGLYVTENGGTSWSLLYNAASHVYGVAIDQEITSTLFIGTFEGSILRSDDRGNRWTQLEGYHFKWAKTPVIDPYNKGMLYVATFGSSVWYGPATAGMD